MTSLIVALLRDFAARADTDRPPLVEAAVRASPAELDWALDAGLGPLLHARLSGAAIPSSLRARLLAADLTARVLVQQRVDVAVDAIDACRGESPTLLKGISLSHYQYEAPHCRPMTDVDVLLAGRDAVEVAERELLARGYWQSAPVMWPDSHHAEPLYHPRTDTKLELHFALFPAGSPLARSRAFSREALARESLQVEFHGRRVRRLSPELQLVYLAATWNRDLSSQALDPSFVIGLFDAVALTRPPFDWDRTLDLIDDGVVAASVDVVLAYLARHRLLDVPSGVVTAIRRRHRIVGPAEIAVLAALVDGYLLKGRPFGLCNSWRIWAPLLSEGDRPGVKSLKIPWYVAVPPRDLHRYDSTYQWERLKRWLARRFASRE